MPLAPQLPPQSSWQPPQMQMSSQSSWPGMPPVELPSPQDSTAGTLESTAAGPQEDWLEEFVPVPRSLIGLVIGPKGATINGIRSQTGVWKMDATDQSSDPCQVKIAGDSDSVDKAKELLLDLVKPMPSRYAGTEHIQIPRGQFEKVIAREGTTVADIEAQTGTHIETNLSCEPCKIYIIGSSSGVRTAKLVLLQLPEEASLPVNVLKYVDGVGFVSKGESATIKRP